MKRMKKMDGGEEDSMDGDHSRVGVICKIIKKKCSI